MLKYKTEFGGKSNEKIDDSATLFLKDFCEDPETFEEDETLYDFLKTHSDGGKITSFKIPE
jgi:hypothetical protein